MSANCKGCVHWGMGPGRVERVLATGTLRECHANPPTVICDPTNGRFRSMFPVTHEDDWCDLGDDDNGEA